MKRTTTLLILMASFGNPKSFGQINEGNLWLGGSIGYNHQKQENPFSGDRKFSGFNVSPAIGKAIRQNLIAGIELNFSHSHEEGSAIPNDVKSNNYGGGLFLRKYFPVVKNFYFFGHAALGGNYNTQKVDNAIVADSKTKGWQLNGTIYPGVSYSLKPSVMLEASFINLFYIGYSRSKTTTGNDVYRNNQFGAGLSLNNTGSFGLGIRFIMPG